MAKTIFLHGLQGTTFYGLTVKCPVMKGVKKSTFCRVQIFPKENVTKYKLVVLQKPVLFR